MTKPTGKLLIASCGAALWIASGATVSQAEDPANKQMFMRYCGACHGPGGKGDGFIAFALKTTPADLTQIAKKNGGTFPYNQTIQFIDGTKDVRAHGNPDMPVWGEVFKQHTTASPTQQAEIRGKIMMITDYIASIQAK
jgi:mono/diheme cytochrome c family protein